MDLAAVRKGRKKSLFRPWNSYLAKKGVVDAAPRARSNDVARARAGEGLEVHFAPLARLTAGLLDTYEGINTAYYERKRRGGKEVEREREVGSEGGRGDGRVEGRRGGGGGRGAGSEASLSADEVATRGSGEMGWGRGGTGSCGSVPSGDREVLGEVDAEKKRKGKTRSSPMSVQYCDENFDYIVRTGEMFNNRYMLEKVIGRGSFGQVVRAYDTRDNTHVAIKIIKNNSLYVEQALSEVRMTSYLNRIDPEDAHSIMRLRDKFIFRGHQCLVLELLSFSLYDLIRSTEFYGVSLNLVRKFCKQILRCLAFLSRMDVNIAHCDLKPENVLLRHPQRSAIKVVDFGASSRISVSMFTYVQSRFYRAPEVILGLPYDTQVDVWSLGCMLIELHTGYPVFAGKDEGHQIAIIVERLGLPPAHMLEAGKKTALFFDRNNTTGEWEIRPEAWPNREPVVPGSKPIDAFVDYHTGKTSGRRKRVSGGHSEVDYEIFLSLAGQMLQYDPKRRCTADEALDDCFVRGSSSKSGRDSPPPIPSMGAVGDHVVKNLDPGRKAPVQRMRKGVEISNLVSVHTHTDTSIGNLPESTDLSADVGGKLRLSKSEPAFEPVPKKTFVFKTSDWAEEVGIEPPPWRAGGSAAPCGDEMSGGVLRRRDLRRNLGAAGGGCQMERRQNRVQSDAWFGGPTALRMRASNERFVFGLGASAAQEAGKRVVKPPLFNPALPRGHGNALLLFLP